MLRVLGPAFCVVTVCLTLGVSPALAQKMPVPAPTNPAPTSPAPRVPAAPMSGDLPGALGALEAGFEPGDLADFNAYVASSGGQGAMAMGHLLYGRRHIDRAAWFFGQAALANPGDLSAQNNLAALLTELAVADPARNAGLLPVALQAARAAVALAPDSAAAQNTLGNAARAAGQGAEAVAAHERAVALAPDEALYWTNLARARAAMGDMQGAAEALARAHALDPNGPAVRYTAAALPGVAVPYRQQLARQCSVDFRCGQICPGGITGGVMRVTCEMENGSARLACQEGQPYATSYNCQEEFPEYGILIPGLNSGFSVSLPGFSAHVLVDGDGQVRVRVEGGVSAGRLGVYVGADGRWSPSNGASFDRFRGGVRFNILPRAAGGGSPVDERAGQYGHPPAHIELEGNSGGPTTLGVEAFNAGLIST